MDHDKKIITVSVVLAVKNEIQSIFACLDSLLKQKYDPSKYEILVYDGGSIDGTTEILDKVSRKYPQVKIFNNPKGIAAAGWNDGFQQSKAKYVVMMGGHTQIASDFIEKNLEILENENVCCAGGRVEAIGENLKSQAIALAFNHPFGAGDARYRYSKKKCYVETVNYGMYRKSVVDSVPPMNETIKRGEDWEYNYNIVQKFGKMVYSPEIKSYYYSRTSFSKLWKRQYDAGKYKLDIIRKFPRSLLLRHVVPFLFSFFAIVLLFLTLTGLNHFFFLIFWIVYLATNLSISFYISSKKGYRFFPLLIWAFFIMQFAYGIGFLVGLVKLPLKSFSN